jgi:hypothetical protein
MIIRKQPLINKRRLNEKFQCNSCFKIPIRFQMEKGGGLKSLRPPESMVGLEVRSQVDQMFVDGVGLEFTLPPGIEIFFWIFFQEYYPL